MNKNTRSNKKAVHFESRRQKLVTCPHCWTDQRTDRDFCFRCGAEFLYLDEGFTANKLFLFLLDDSALQLYIESIQNFSIGGIQNADHPSGKANAFGRST